MRYTIWDSVCNHCINQGEDAEVNSIVGIIKPNGIGTVALDLEDDTGKLHNSIKKNYTNSLGYPSSL